MTIKNKYSYRSRVSDTKFRELVKLFSLDIEAKKTAVLVRLNRNTINRYYLLIRKRIAEYCEMEGCRLGFKEDTDIGDSTDGTDNICQEYKNDSMLFGICLSNDRIYTEIIKETDTSGDTGRISSLRELECFLGTRSASGRRDFQAVVDYDSSCYIRTNSGNGDCKQFTNMKSCDLFWGFVKSRLMKFNGISKSTLYLHIKECEFRFNHRNQNIYKLLLNIIRENPLTAN